MYQLDAASSWQILFQDPATPVMEGIIDFHHDIMVLLIFVVFFVLFFIASIIYNFSSFNTKSTINRFSHNTDLEIAWTIIPAAVLFAIAAPSFALLYSIDELVSPSITFKAIGHQWYWHYEYSDFGSLDTNTLNLECYMVQKDDLTKGLYRLLETTSRLVLPTGVHIRALFTSADVLHSWAVPSLGVKVDSCPGRLNQAGLFLKREGVFYGQCSEICGVNHGFMPIVVEAVSLKEYAHWLSKEISTE